MQMLLTGIFASLFAVIAALIAFVEAAPKDDRPNLSVNTLKADEESQFFTSWGGSARESKADVPVEALVAQIENHVRLEQAAAESFVADPNSRLLHSRTVSPFVN
jgi:hypothetical protein